MSAPTHLEVYISSMKREADYSRLTERGETADFFDVEVRQVETDPTHQDWTGEIEILDEAEDIPTHEQAVEIARQFCTKHDLPEDSWEDQGD